MSDETFSPWGLDLFGQAVRPEPSGELERRHEFVPATVIDSRSGDWCERKRAWLALGIKSELGRGGNLLRYSDTVLRMMASDDPRKNGGDPLTVADYEGGNAWTSGTSTFDPALCELIYRFWCPPGGLVLDPFAGGSVRGIVAAKLGHRYHGIELREEQVAANREQARDLCSGGEPLPRWVCGDSAELARAAPEADLVFSCPPYGDLERYSDDPKDLSTLSYPNFLGSLRQIVKDSCSRLKPNRFACFVIGDFRDKRTGALRGFPADCVQLFRDAGLELYNDAILVTPSGSLAIRMGRPFASGRKLGRCHQYVSVFLKGDAKKAAAATRGEPG
jgi:hypothetical protein